MGQNRLEYAAAPPHGSYDVFAFKQQSLPGFVWQLVTMRTAAPPAYQLAIRLMGWVWCFM
jgi:hypothetical protein